MKSFDLTFNGTVLPGYDLERVKQDFAVLFGIEDSALIEEIFSGANLVLRHNLDRKTAADYFRKITQLGAQPTLVTSNQRGATAGEKAGKLELVVGSTPRIIREPGPEQRGEEETPFRQTGEMHQSWPISTARIQRQQSEVNGAASTASLPGKAATTIELASELASNSQAITGNGLMLEPAVQPITPKGTVLPASDLEKALEDASHTNHVLTSNRETQARLQALADKAKHKLRVKSAELQRRREKIDQIAGEKMADIEQQVAAAAEQSEKVLRDLQKQAETQRQAAAALASRAQQQQSVAREQTEQKLKQLEALKKQAAEQEKDALTHLKQSLEETRLTAAEDIRRLRNLIQEAQRQAQMDIASLERQLGEVKAKAFNKVAELEQNADEARHALDRDLEALQQEHAAARQQQEQKGAALKEQLLATQQDKKKVLDKLQALKQKITLQQNQRIAELEEASSRLRKRTQKALKQVHSMELEVKRRQSDALASNSTRTPSATEPVEPPQLVS